MNETEMTEATKNKFQDWQRRATQKARDMGQFTDQYVHENTWSTVAIAAVVGCVIGFLLANRRD